jgi:transposase
MRRYGLCDDQWDRIRNLLPGREGHVGVTARDNRLFVEAVLYRFRTGVPWRDLPERFGRGVKVQRRFSRWAKAGVWEQLFQHLAAEADNEYAMIDSTIVRAHSMRPAPPKTWRGSGHRPQQGRADHDNSCPGGCAWQSDRRPSDRRSGARSGWSGCVAP